MVGGLFKNMKHNLDFWVGHTIDDWKMTNLHKGWIINSIKLKQITAILKIHQVLINRIIVKFDNPGI